MKTCRLVALASLVLCLKAFAAAAFDVPHVSVYGTATTEVIPDLMHWRVEVRTQGKEVVDVAAEHDRNVAAVLSFLKKEEIDEKKTQTSRLQLNEHFEYQRGTRTKNGYIASTSVAFESEAEDELYRALWTGLSQLKAVTVNGATFDTSNRIPLQEKTRLAALAAARNKARALALELERNIGHPLLIEEERSSAVDQRSLLNNVRMQRVAADAAAPQSSLSLGTIAIEMRIKAVFSLVP